MKNDSTKQDKVRALRLFNFKFRIALDLITDFKGVYSYTKTPQVKRAYIELFNLLQLWNSYEALISYRSTTENKDKFYELDTKDFLKKSNSIKILKAGSNQIKKEYYENEQYKNEFDQYFAYLRTHTKHPRYIIPFNEYLQGDKEFNGLEFLNLIYAERNLAYHEGEAVQMGWDYGRRIRLIKVYKITLICHILNTINYLIEEDLKTI